jgi:predicted nucleic acid-binding protein
MILRLDEIRNQLSLDSSLKLGCIVDTNVLFAASYPLDLFNEWAEKVFALLHQLQIPIYTNLNVRSEFIELNRRVLIPEGLISLLEDRSGQLNLEIETQLKLLKARSDKAIALDKTFKLNDTEIKKYRHLLTAFKLPSGENAWELFCNDYLHQYITTIWDDAVSALKINFLGTREIDEKNIIDSHPKWADMVDIIGKFGIGTSDAMIINLFLKSKLPLIVTADSDVRDAVLAQSPHNKYVLAPE